MRREQNVNLGSLLSHAANFGVAASTATSLADRFQGKKKRGRTVKRASKNPFEGQLEIPQEIIDRFGEEYINAIFDSPNPEELLNNLIRDAYDENDYWSVQDFETLLGLLKAAEAQALLEHNPTYLATWTHKRSGYEGSRLIEADNKSAAMREARTTLERGAYKNLKIHGRPNENPFFTDEDEKAAKRVQTTNFCKGCEVEFKGTEGIVTQSYRDADGVQWFEVKPKRGGLIAIPASDVRIMHNPSYTVHLELPSVRESVDVKAFTVGGALRKGKSRLRGASKTHPKWSVEKNSAASDEARERLNEFARLFEIEYLRIEAETQTLDDAARLINETGQENLNNALYEAARLATIQKLAQENPLHHGPTFAGSNIRELHHGPQYKRTARKYGKEVAHRQAIAAGLSAAGVSRNPYRVVIESTEDHNVLNDSFYESYTAAKEMARSVSIPVGQRALILDDDGEVLSVFEDGKLLWVSDYEKFDKYEGKLNPSSKKRKTLPLALVLNPNDRDRLNALLSERERIGREIDASLSGRDNFKNYGQLKRKYDDIERRILKERGKLAARNPETIHPSTKSKLNQISEMFHGPNNQHKGRVSHHYVSDHVKARNFSRAGSATVIKLVNDIQKGHEAPDHWCDECALFPNPQTSILGISTGKRVQLMGKGVHALGKRIKRNLDRMDETELDELGVKREKSGGYDLGKADTQVYTTVEKWSDIDDPDTINYFHEWAEETRELEDKPSAKIDENGMIYLSGGKHTVTKAGIEN